MRRLYDLYRQLGGLFAPVDDDATPTRGQQDRIVRVIAPPGFHASGHRAVGHALRAEREHTQAITDMILGPRR